MEQLWELLDREVEAPRLIAREVWARAVIDSGALTKDAVTNVVFLITADTQVERVWALHRMDPEGAARRALGLNSAPYDVERWQQIADKRLIEAMSDADIR